ncbi:YbhB/YbcL family Raf kinase inhibitor-like protein [Caldivirga maquilingensis]|uniref:PEBP family protein n=1 Tax=Caldivirga maquilingensis (strain ATCC 700844 / DSM 13496 / JCM 10307 / IC-167) TaxID=397948 RepID=A8MC76_CALMQ|nr:YbhB/YbcL family Raf kinase inhibitor-like protein [Caldivirga maquilingensis]ABW01382.1 PEBP family protein [Caldivirga maquilingensis IC-167]
MRIKPSYIITTVILVIIMVALVVIMTLSGGSGGGVTVYEPNLGLGGFSIKVPIYGNESTIPSSYACNGVNFTSSPPLIISNIPSGTRSLMVVMIDVDANMFIHWALVNAPPVSLIPPNLPHSFNTSFGEQLINDFGNVGFNGPCPPSRHMYIIIVYALNSTINVKDGKYTYAQLVSMIKNHVLATALWIGYYG